MKIVFTLCLGLLLLLSSCGSSSPDNVAADFSVALNNFNFDQAKTLSTKKTHQLISLIESAASMATDEDKEQPKKGEPSCTCEEKETTADCECCYQGETKDCMNLSLVKKDGTWLVDISKENLMEGGN